jgi:hypothetical protein
MKNEFINLACGAAQQNISQIVIKQQPVCCDTKTIAAFHKQVEPYFDKIQYNQEQAFTLSQLRDRVLSWIMNEKRKI